MTTLALRSEDASPLGESEAYGFGAASQASTAPARRAGEAADRPDPTDRRVRNVILTIVNKRGLHARASAKFVQTAERFEAEIAVSRDGMTVGGQSIMGLMMLAASQGTTIEVTAEGADAEAALAAIESLVADRFGEEA